MPISKPYKTQTLGHAIKTALLMSMVTQTAHAETTNDKLHFNIPAQSLNQALLIFGKQSHQQLMYGTDIAENLRSHALQGDYTATEAITILLSDAPLQPTTQEGTITLQPKAKVVPNKGDTVTLKPMTVRAKVFDQTDPYDTDYSHTNASTATKTDTPIMETPFSVQVVPQQILKDQQVVNLQDATKNISGVQTGFGYGNLYQNFTIRGFETTNILRNGQRNAGGVGRSMVEMANVDSVEVLKGPAAMLYGRLDPGGMINVITNKPLDTTYYSLQQQFGSYNMYRTTLDATGPINKDKTLMYRLNYSYFDAASYQNNAPHSDSNFVTPSLTWRPNDKFETNINFEYRNANPFFQGGVPVSGNRPVTVPITNYLQGLSSDKTNIDRKLADFNWSYKFNDAWKIRNGVTATFDDINFKQSYFASNFDPVNGTIGLTPSVTKRTSQGYNSFLDLTGEFNTYGVGHKVLLGTDHYLLDYKDLGFTAGWGIVANQNIYNPTSIAWLDPYTSNASLLQAAQQQVPDYTQAGTASWNGVYLQDQLKIMEKFHLLLGGRYDWAETNGGFSLDPETPAFSLTRATVKDQKFSPRAGLLYDVTNWLSVYGNYVESLGNAGGYGAVTFTFPDGAHGIPLHASASSSYEGGLKVQAFDKRLLSTLAFFEIDKTNMATRDLSSSNQFAMVNAGKARSRGIEFDITGAITKDLSLIGSYAYTDTRFTSNNDGLQGNALANVPKNSGSIWAKYQLLPEHLSVGFGGNFRGARQGDNANTFIMPGYATLDTYIAYNFKVMGRSKLTTQLNVNNILDKRYFINSNNYDATPTLGVMPGQPLMVMGSIRLEY